jgi:predicted 2-oxoglutarate/Fe(II)-dependent dioxygenase YbiX
MINKELKDFIIVIKQAMYTDLCEDIIAEYKDCNEWIAGIDQADVTNPTGKYRNCQMICTTPTSIRNNHKRIELDNRMFEVISRCIKVYRMSNPTCKIVKDTGYDLLKYEPGGYYVTHTDSCIDFPREVSCSVLLNDNFVGGEFSFFNKSLSYKLSQGDVIMFPANFMFPHEVTEVLDGTRLSMVTWFR